MTFFSPTKKFTRWLVQLAAGRPIIDCGAGDGLLTRKLIKAGANVLGIDICSSGNGIIVPYDATRFSFPSKAIVLFCRPCHSDWVEATIRKAKNQASVILYVGLEKNFSYDLGEYERRFRKIGVGAGKEEECVWTMDGIENDISRWCLIKPTFWRYPFWVEDKGDRWLNLAGGWFSKGKEKVLKSVLTDDYRRLDWRKTSLYLDHPDNDAGWLEPNGSMHYCDYNDHNLYADLILHRDSEALLNDGWCHVWGRGIQPYFHGRGELTAEQKNFLQMNGYPFRFEDSEEPKQISIGNGGVYPTPPGLFKRDKTSE